MWYTNHVCPARFITAISAAVTTERGCGGGGTNAASVPDGEGDSTTGSEAGRKNESGADAGVPHALDGEAAKEKIATEGAWEGSEERVTPKTRAGRPGDAKDKKRRRKNAKKGKKKNML